MATSSKKISENFPEILDGIMHSSKGRVERDAFLGGDVFEGNALGAQCYDFALFDWKLLDGRGKCLLALIVGELFVRGAVRRGVAFGHLIVTEVFPRTEEIHHEVVGDTAEPGKESLLVSVASEVLGRLEPSLLEDVVHHGRLALQQLVQIGKEREPVTRVQLLERPLVTQAASLYQLYVIAVLWLCHHIYLISCPFITQ